jgi:hypothetical protein
MFPACITQLGCGSVYLFYLLHDRDEMEWTAPTNYFTEDNWTLLPVGNMWYVVVAAEPVRRC